MFLSFSCNCPGCRNYIKLLDCNPLVFTIHCRSDLVYIYFFDYYCPGNELFASRLEISQELIMVSVILIKIVA